MHEQNSEQMIIVVYVWGGPFITFANRADPDQPAALSGSTLFAYLLMEI